jgi:hypothetical protein
VQRVRMAKHLLKISSYVENEAILYCPQRNSFQFIKIEFPMVCPFCQKLFRNKDEIKFVLKQDLL